MMEGVNKSRIYLIYFKMFCKCYNVPPAQQKKKKKDISTNMLSYDHS
jgi:hypothetical protein